MKRKIFLGLIVVLIVIQFIRPTRNSSVVTGPHDITMHYAVPADIQAILKSSCNDCHSDNTEYPWYSNVQPVGWWIQHDVNEAKHHLNFSVFGTYPEKKAKHKFEDIEDAAVNGWMPLESYLWFHPEAKLTPEQSKALGAWAAALK
jgi:hypothetical protein